MIELDNDLKFIIYVVIWSIFCIWAFPLIYKLLPIDFHSVWGFPYLSLRF